MAPLAALPLAGCAQGAGGGTTVEATEWAFDPSTTEATAGEAVTVRLVNPGGVAPNLAGEFGRTETIQSGAEDSLTVTFDEPGEYPFWCAVAGHRDAGMEGTVVVY